MRLEVRIPASDRELLQHAADYAGVSVAAYVRRTAVAAAHRDLILTDDE